MNKKILFLMKLCVVLVVAVLAFPAGDLVAADCKALRNQAQQMTSLLKKRDFLKDAVSMCAEDPYLNYDYAKTLERLRKYEEALHYYTIASRFQSTRANAFFGMGDVFVILSEPQKAAVAYEKGLAVDPSNDRAKQLLVELQKKFNIKVTPPAAVVVQEPPAPAPAPAHEPSASAAVKGPDLKLQTPFK
jgi:tetratricopeptide (TPR) repeat protein